MHDNLSTAQLAPNIAVPKLMIFTLFCAAVRIVDTWMKRRSTLNKVLEGAIVDNRRSDLRET